jgi:DNA-binding PadR family transcriptional regulator
MLKHGILGLLNYGEMTGYEIMTAFRDSLQFFWTANTSQIYRELQTLKKNGFVTDRKVEQQGKPDKNIFTITDEGREELKTWLRKEDYGNRNMGLLMKTFFAGELSPEENIERFRHIQAGCDEFLKGLSKADSAVDRYRPVLSKTPEKSMYWNMTISFGRKYMKMLRKWCSECISELEEIQK